MNHYKTEPPWKFLLSASRNSLQSYELSRLSHAANLRKELVVLLELWMEENSAAMLARWWKATDLNPYPILAGRQTLRDAMMGAGSATAR